MTIKLDEHDILKKTIGRYSDTDRSLVLAIGGGLLIFASDTLYQVVQNLKHRKESENL